MDSDDKPLMQQIFEKLERDGKLVKTGRMRNGKPVYVCRTYYGGGIRSRAQAEILGAKRNAAGTG